MMTGDYDKYGRTLKSYVVDTHNTHIVIKCMNSDKNKMGVTKLGANYTAL